MWTLFHSTPSTSRCGNCGDPLLHGGRLVVVPHDVSRSPADFRRLLARERVTVLNQTPSAFYQLVQADAQTDAQDPGDELALRYVVFGGEALDLNRLTDWYERHAPDAPVLVNMYGITETTVHVTRVDLDERSAARHPAGTIGGPSPDCAPTSWTPTSNRRRPASPATVRGGLWPGPRLATPGRG